MPKKSGDMVVVELLDFPGVLSQGFDLADARVMIASALEDMAGDYLEQGRSLPQPDPNAVDPEADLIELLPLRVTAGATRP
jgi:predicted RNase H-like HicB family nuclease